MRRKESLGIKVLSKLDPDFWRSKAVFVTGHTGFKGGWLSFLLSHFGANVSGFSLPPNTTPNFFELTRLRARLGDSHIADIRDFEVLSTALNKSDPEIIFHLAAQPLVRLSYADPLHTYTTNVLGTLNLLQAARGCSSLRAVVIVTSDKCYENLSWPWGYRETDTLGGHDPYSNSKACQELVVAGFRASYLRELGISVASARAGNVIGGGDWSEDRLIPDVIRAHQMGKDLVIRNPSATRPWQHVLEPVCAYLTLAEKLFSSTDFSSEWNFGPADRDVRSVQEVLKLASEQLSGGLTWRNETPAQELHEAKLLKLDCSKAHAYLGWKPRWGLEVAIEKTCDWYTQTALGQDAALLTEQQIRSFLSSPIL
jgi:CDP-glucose 4,6-dehydratase